MLTVRQTAARIGVARSTLYEMIARRELPPPVHLGPRDRAYAADVIDSWLKQRGERSTA